MIEQSFRIYIYSSKNIKYLIDLTKSKVAIDTSFGVDKYILVLKNSFLGYLSII